MANKLRKYALGRKGKTSALLPDGKGMAVVKARRKVKQLESMSQEELLSLLKRKKYALEAAERLGTKLERMTARNLKQIALDHYLRTQHRVAGASTHFYRKMGKGKLEELKLIIKRLKAAGVNCEEIESVSKRGSYYEAKMGNAGRSIIQVKKTKKMLEGIAKLLGKMHAAGVLHTHPHQGNIVIDKKGRLAIIDLMEARKVKVSWNNPQSVFLEFLQDYKRLYDALKRQIGSEENLYKFFEKLVSRYPATKECKETVLESIDHFLIHGFTFRR